jgi:hypothetical protein
MADIFLSYKSEDRDQTGVIAAALQAEGFTVWWDPVLRTGETYDETIERELRAAHVIVVLWTPRSVVSRWVRAEATIADRRSALAPVMLEPCERPIAFELVQTADLIGWTADRADPRWRTLVGELKDRVTQARGQAQNPNAAPAPDPLTIETLFWSSIKDSADRADFETYLQRYPHGHFAELAQNRLAGLSRSAGPAAPVPSAKTAPPARQAPSQPSEKILWGHFAALLLALLTLGAGADAVFQNAVFARDELRLSAGQFEFIAYNRIGGLLIGGMIAVWIQGIAGRSKGLLMAALGVLAIGSAFASIPTTFVQLQVFTSIFNVVGGLLTVLILLTGLRLFPDRRALLASTALFLATIAFPSPWLLNIGDRAGLGGFAAVSAVGFAIAAIWIAILRWPPPPPATQEKPPALVTWSILLAGSGYTACYWVLTQAMGGTFDGESAGRNSWLAMIAGVALGCVVTATLTRGAFRPLVYGGIITALAGLTVAIFNPFFFSNEGVWLASQAIAAAGLGVMLALVWRSAEPAARPWVVWLYCALPPIFMGVAFNDPLGLGAFSIGLAGALLVPGLIIIGRLALPKTIFRN